MKITINVDCTPEEARRYMGLPDVAPMQKAMLSEMQDRMMANLSTMQPTEMINAWLPGGVSGWVELQKAYWQKMTSVSARSDDES